VPQGPEAVYEDPTSIAGRLLPYSPGPPQIVSLLIMRPIYTFFFLFVKHNSWPCVVSKDNMTMRTVQVTNS